MKKIILVVLALIVAACSTSSEYDQKLKQWTDAGVSHYRYDLVIGCFCPFSQDMPLTIEVKDGQVVSITNVEGVLLDASNPSYQYYLEYATIDLLFAELKSEMAEAEELTVAYDPQYGFPSEVWIDRIKLAVDDEMSLQVTNFEVLE
ncbi:MAG: DUF6174 domain-containing protein [Chloroflexota bacterium]|jgi:hypothetical protein